VGLLTRPPVVRLAGPTKRTVAGFRYGRREVVRLFDVSVYPVGSACYAMSKAQSGALTHTKRDSQAPLGVDAMAYFLDSLALKARCCLSLSPMGRSRLIHSRIPPPWTVLTKLSVMPE